MGIDEIKIPHPKFDELSAMVRRDTHKPSQTTVYRNSPNHLNVSDKGSKYDIRIYGDTDDYDLYQDVTYYEIITENLFVFKCNGKKITIVNPNKIFIMEK